MSSSFKIEKISLQFVCLTHTNAESWQTFNEFHQFIMTVYVSSQKCPFYFHKDWLGQYSLFFQKAFYDSFQKAIIKSIYLEADSINELILFKEWLYLGKLDYPDYFNKPSLFLIKVFCFADKVEFSNLQNTAVDSTCNQVIKKYVSSLIKGGNFDIYTNYPSSAWQHPALSLNYAKKSCSIIACAIIHAYQNTSEFSLLKKLLMNIFAFNISFKDLGSDIDSFSTEFLVNILLINMKQLPYRLNEEKADFDDNTDKYHTHYSLNPSDELSSKRTDFSVEELLNPH